MSTPDPRRASSFADRVEAGRALVAGLAAYGGREDVVVYGLPRGGVPVAAEVARALDLPLDVLLVRKLRLPRQPELAMGAIAEGGVVLFNADVMALDAPAPAAVSRILDQERRELERRLAAYRAGRPPASIAGRVALVVDDGLATGATMEAAVRAVRARGAARVVVAVPVAAHEACDRVRAVADEVVVVLMPSPFHAVGAWYVDFEPTDDDEVIALLTGAPR